MKASRDLVKTAVIVVGKFLRGLLEMAFVGNRRGNDKRGI